MSLAAFLREHVRRPFEWAIADCCTFPADWVLACRGVDPMADLRGGYSGRAGARALVRASGGLVALWRPRLEAVGARPAVVPSAGDVGVIRGPLGPSGAIRGDIGWFVLSDRGLLLTEAPALAIWRV